MPGKFELYKDKAGQKRFRLKASNGEVILSSEGYRAKAGCANGIESVRKNCARPERFVKTNTSSGKYRFNLVAGNHQVIATSQSYESESSRDKGVASVGKAAPGAKVVDVDK
jgi:uncharacterized protein YegP (UPF0339 family)